MKNNTKLTLIMHYFQVINVVLLTYRTGYISPTYLLSSFLPRKTRFLPSWMLFLSSFECIERFLNVFTVIDDKIRFHPSFAKWINRHFASRHSRSNLPPFRSVIASLLAINNIPRYLILSVVMHFSVKAFILQSLHQH